MNNNIVIAWSYILLTYSQSFPFKREEFVEQISLKGETFFVSRSQLRQG